MFEFFEKIKNGLLMIALSLQIMWNHTPLLLFPLLKMIVVPLYLGLLLGFIRIVTQNYLPNHYLLMGIFLILFLLTAFLTLIIFTFVDVATIKTTAHIFENKNDTITQNLNYAWHKRRLIFLWALADSAAHTVLNVLSGDNKNKNSLGSLASATLNLAWKAATFFVTPIMAHESLSLIETIKKSSRIFKDTFGETIGISAGLSTINGLIFPGIIIVFAWSQKMFSYKPIHDSLLIMIIVGVGSFFLRMITSTALQIFKTAAYQHAEGKNAGIFKKYFSTIK